MRVRSLAAWIDDLQSAGRYSFLRRDAVHNSGLSVHAAGKALQRAVKGGRLVKVKEYFYVIVPLEYRSVGAPPVGWYIHDLMRAMKLPYYVGLLSAAALHGASHQQPQVFHVMTDRTVRPMSVSRTRILFFATKHVEQAATVDMKTPTGTMRVSTAETTVVDLVRFSRVAGRMDHVASVIAEMAELLEPRRLQLALGVVKDVPNAQRLGYLLDLLRKRRLSRAVHDWVGKRVTRYQRLRPDRPADQAVRNGRWFLLINAPLEIEA